MNKRIWFLSNRWELVDLNTAEYFLIEQIEEKKFVVTMYRLGKDDEWGYSLAQFKKQEDARDYLARIRNILVESV